MIGFDSSDFKITLVLVTAHAQFPMIIITFKVLLEDLVIPTGLCRLSFWQGRER